MCALHFHSSPLHSKSDLILYSSSSFSLPVVSSHLRDSTPVSAYQSMARVQAWTRTRPHLSPNQYRIYRGSFSLLTELSSQGWLVSPGCGSLAELHTSRMAADTETHFELLKPTKQSKVHTTVLSSLADL